MAPSALLSTMIKFKNGSTVAVRGTLIPPAKNGCIIVTNDGGKDIAVSYVHDVIDADGTKWATTVIRMYQEV